MVHKSEIPSSDVNKPMFTEHVAIDLEEYGRGFGAALCARMPTSRVEYCFRDAKAGDISELTSGQLFATGRFRDILKVLRITPDNWLLSRFNNAEICPCVRD
jgi:hypothetical protein